MKQLILIAIVGSLITLRALAQGNADAPRKNMMDSVKNAYLTEAALGNPVLRQIVVSTDFIPSSDIRSYLHGKEIFKGKIVQQRTNALFNIPVISWGKNSVMASISLIQQHLELTHITPMTAGLPELENKSFNTLTSGFSPSFIRTDSLFGKMIIYTATVTILTNHFSSIEKTSYLGGVIFMLKQTALMHSSVGLLINIDPSINVPVLPVYSYWRKFNSGWELNVNLPQGLSTRKNIAPQLWASFGETLSGSVAFFHYNYPGFPNDVNYSTIDLKSGAGLEYRFGKRILIGLNGGLMAPLQNRAFDHTESINNYFLRNKLKTTPFANFTISVLPFLHGF